MIIPQRWLLAQLSEGVASLFKGGLHFGGVTSIFWLGNGSRSWAFWVVLLCESFLFHYTQIWGFSHIEICLWWENCHLRRKGLVWGTSGGRAGMEVSSPAHLHCTPCAFSYPLHPPVSEIPGTLARATDPSPLVNSYCHCLLLVGQAGLLSLFQMWVP